MSPRTVLRIPAEKKIGIGELTGFSTPGKKQPGTPLKIHFDNFGLSAIRINNFHKTEQRPTIRTILKKVA
jgi:hypothetical protein